MTISTCNPNASPCVKKLMEYLKSIEGKRIITGQHTQTMAQEELQLIQKETGKLPALCGIELLSYSPNIDLSDADEACITEVKENQGTLAKAYEWAEKGGILTFTWHWFSPMYGRDKAFYSKNTEFDAEKALIEGTPENKAMCHDLDVMAELLEDFNKKNIPILWRPFHESEGNWFWWGAKGVKVAAELYRFMWHYFTEKHHLNNLIWVWNSPAKDGYVGDDYCDILTRDNYPQPHNHTDLADKYNELRAITSEKMIANGEIGVIPDVEALNESRVPWLWYMTWSKDFCLGEQFTTFDELRKMYNHPYSITLEDIKDLKLSGN